MNVTAGAASPRYGQRAFRAPVTPKLEPSPSTASTLRRAIVPTPNTVTYHRDANGQPNYPPGTLTLSILIPYPSSPT